MYYMTIAIEIYLHIQGEETVIKKWIKIIRSKGIFYLFKHLDFIFFFISSLFILFLMVYYHEWFLVFFISTVTASPSEADLLYKIHNQ